MYAAKSNRSPGKWAVFSDNGAEQVGTTRATEEEAQDLVDAREKQEEEMKKRREELRRERFNKR